MNGLILIVVAATLTIQPVWGKARKMDPVKPDSTQQGTIGDNGQWFEAKGVRWEIHEATTPMPGFHQGPGRKWTIDRITSGHRKQIGVFESQPHFEAGRNSDQHYAFRLDSKGDLEMTVLYFTNEWDSPDQRSGTRTENEQIWKWNGTALVKTSERSATKRLPEP